MVAFACPEKPAVVDSVAGDFLKFHRRDGKSFNPEEYRLAKTLFALTLSKGKKTRIGIIWDNLEAGIS